jgi:Lon protease-like protein
MGGVTARRLVRLFPLPNVVLFPGTTVPLHVFEPRYRAMLSEALESDRLIGMQLLRPDGPGAGGRDVFEIGCAGEVVHHEPLEDGRSNILLRGTFRYRIEREQTTDTPWRVAEVTPLPVEPLPPAGRGGRGPAELRRLLSGSVRRLADAAGRPGARELGRNLSDEALVNEAASRLGLDAEESYRLLTMDRLEERYAWVLAYIEGVQRRLDFLGPYRLPDADPRWN